MGQKTKKVIGELASVALGAASSWLVRALYANEWAASTYFVLIVFIVALVVKLYFLLKHETLEEKLGQMTSKISENNQKVLQTDSEIAVADKEAYLELSNRIKEAAHRGDHGQIETFIRLQEQIGQRRNGQ